MRILLVDNDEKILRMLGDFFHDRGHEVHAVQSGAKALSFLHRTVVDAVLCDIQMPGIDGIAFLHGVRARWPDLPVVVLTGDREQDTAIAAFRSGACDFLKKPIDPRDLMARITGIVDASHAQG